MGQLSNSSREWGEACDTWGREACIGRAYNFYPEGGGVPLKDFKKVNYVFFLFILFLFIYLFIYLFLTQVSGAHMSELCFLNMILVIPWRAINEFEKTFMRSFRKP
jgi:hypothetical protein